MGVVVVRSVDALFVGTRFLGAGDLELFMSFVYIVLIWRMFQQLPFLAGIVSKKWQEKD